MGTSCGMTVSKKDLQIFTSEFESHCVPHSFTFVTHLRKKNLVNNLATHVPVGLPLVHDGMIASI